MCWCVASVIYRVVFQYSVVCRVYVQRTVTVLIVCVCVCTHNFKVALIGVLHNIVVTCTLLLVGRSGGGIFVYSELCIHGML